MEIRSVTCFADLEYPLDPAQWRQIARFAASARSAFTDAGYRVQTVRFATQSFADLLAVNEALGLVEFAQEMEAAARDSGVDYVSLGPAPGATREAGWVLAEEIPEALGATENVFFGIEIASAEGIDLQGIGVAARAIQRTSRAVANGFGNLRLAALANVPPWAAFFPAAFHGGGAFRFTIATEAADLAVRAFAEASSPNDAEERLTALIQQDAQALTLTARRLAEELGVVFGGIDFSLAQFPVPEKSIGTAVEYLTGGKFGERGTLFAAGLLTRAIEKADFPRAGFCGLLLPVLEDAVLAARSQEGTYTLDTLLLCSTVCGAGLDTVPLPGDASVEELSAVLADLATLAVRLNKPLTARLMPIPGKKAGERTDFQFAYFANAHTLPLRGAAPGLWR